MNNVTVYFLTYYRLSQASRLQTKQPALSATGQEVMLDIEMEYGRCPVPDTRPP